MRSQFLMDPLSGMLFVFFTKRADIVRVLYWDRDGYVLTTKRLERGDFRVHWKSETGHVTLEAAELLLVLGALNCYSYFMYAKSGHADHLETLLEGYRLTSAMCDGSPTSNCVERAGAKRGGCHAHAWGGLVGARGGDHRAVEGLRVYAKLFHVDAEWKRAGESVGQRLARRKRDSAPLIAEIQAWVETAVGNAEPKSDLGKALRYIQRQWPRLTRFLEDSLMELTNNEVERDLRTWVLNRKTWRFCGHDASARRAADALTIITTCKKLGHDTRCYIRDTLKRILDGDLTALLAENYKRGGALGSASASAAA